jgi:GH15 family glucan-1,4-alpha-glucosidase
MRRNEDGRPGDGYLPIEHYGAIGNLHTVALVGRNGSIDWACLPDLACPSVFAAIVDRRRGGFFRLAPVRWESSRQRYLEDTCILETSFEAEGGRVRLTDFMPLGGDIVRAGAPRTEPEIYRLAQCDEGEVEMELEWSPRLDYARTRVEVERRGGRFLARGGEHGLWLIGAPGEPEVGEGEGGPVVRSRFRLRAGERVALVTRDAGGDLHRDRDEPPSVTLDGIRERMEETRAAWTRWARHNGASEVEEWAGRWTGLVRRSALTLKLLTHPETGAIAAAATTSLPEEIGGVRNWDYRFCWIRDAVFTAQALYALGHRNEARDFLHFAERSAQQAGTKEWGLQIMYGLHGETELPEECLDHLEGYRGSRPVRIGNGAATQRQLDVYGELLEAAHELVLHGDDLPPDQWRFLASVADEACAAWHHPDQGIWEIRTDGRHFTYSKLMVWAALDRAVKLAGKGKIEGDVERWGRTRDTVKDVTIRRGYDEELGSFVQAFGWKALDASNLLIPVHGLLPPTDPRVLGTIDRTLERLTENGLVYRYDPEEAKDGLDGGEGAFGLCTFWLVDALALAGRVEEAREIFEGIAERASPLGLYAEQIDPESGAFLGNFPQAFTHLGLINSALYLARAEGLPTPELPWPELEASDAMAGPEGRAGNGDRGS